MAGWDWVVVFRFGPPTHATRVPLVDYARAPSLLDRSMCVRACLYMPTTQLQDCDRSLRVDLPALYCTTFPKQTVV